MLILTAIYLKWNSNNKKKPKKKNTLSSLPECQRKLDPGIYFCEKDSGPNFLAYSFKKIITFFEKAVIIDGP